MPSIDVVIAIHDARRRLDRAVGSVLDDAPEGVGVIVVCHGIGSESIAPMLEGLPPDRLSILEINDGIRSPAGPFNAGIDASVADYVAVMGSDDFLEPGALRAWQQLVAQRRPDALIAEQRHHDGAFIPAPLVRRGRSRDLDAVRDRLYYRTAPLGLLRRDYLNDQCLRFTAGAATGEDVVLSTLLWSFGRVDLARGAARYVIGADAPERTSFQPRTFSDAAAGVSGFLNESRIAGLPQKLRCALAVRVARTVLLPVIRQGLVAQVWDGEQQAVARTVFEELNAFGPGYQKPFSRADRAVFDAATKAGARYRSGTRIQGLVPRNPLRTLDRESTATRYLVYALDRQRAISPSGGIR